MSGTTDAADPPAADDAGRPSPGAAPDGSGLPEASAAEPALTTRPQPHVPTAELLVPWVPAPDPAAEHRRRGVGRWALGVGIVALCASLVVGWAFPLGVGGLVLAVVALRRPGVSRLVAGWALALSVVSLLYSALWLAWAASRLALFD